MTHDLQTGAIEQLFDAVDASIRALILANGGQIFVDGPMLTAVSREQFAALLARVRELEADRGRIDGLARLVLADRHPGRPFLIAALGEGNHGPLAVLVNRGRIDHHRAGSVVLAHKPRTRSGNGGGLVELVTRHRQSPVWPGGIALACDDKSQGNIPPCSLLGLHW